MAQTVKPIIDKDSFRSSNFKTIKRL